MRDPVTPAEEKTPPPGKRPIEEVRNALRGIRGTIGLLVFMQLLTLAGLGGLLWHTFLRTG
jgi:hypothetical protein